MIKILILGGGFGGVRCALDLDKKFKGQIQITLVDKNSYHLFLPSLYEVAAIYGTNKDSFAVKMRKTICIPYKDIFAGKNVEFIQAEIAVVDLKTKNVRTKGGEVLTYDYLVIALGGQTADFGIPGVAEYAYQFKSIDDAVAVNLKIGKLIKKMASGEKMDQLRVLIGGGGFTGVELAAEISGCSMRMCRENSMEGRHARITLVEAGPKILPMVSDAERRVVSKRLTELGVMLMENSPIEEIGANFVKLKNGQMLEGDMVIWTTGIKANELIKSVAGLPITDKGKISVDESLQIRGLKTVFAVGDNLEFIDPKTQKPIPGLAYVAADQGRVVAKNIYNLFRGRELETYRPEYKIWIAPVGGKFALAHLWGGRNVSGFLGWVVRELVDLRYMVSILSLRKALSIFWQEVTMFTKND